MKIFNSLTAFLCGSLFIASASAQESGEKIGTVDMQKLVGEYHKTVETREIFKVYEEEVNEQNLTRVETIKAILEEANGLKKQTDDPSLSREKKTELFQELNSKQQEIQGLERDRQAWSKRKHAAIMEKAKIDFGEVRLEILEKVKSYGETEGFDFIFDRSGASGAGVPILSYTKDATDLTSILLGLINKDAPDDAKIGKEEADRE